MQFNTRFLIKLIIAFITTLLIIIFYPSNIYLQLLMQYLLLFILCFLFFKPSKMLKSNKKRIIIHYIIGTLIGIILISSVVFILLWSGNIELIKAQTVNKLIIVLVIPIWMFQSFMEEYIFRGLLFTSINKKLNITLTIIITSILFSLCHIANTGVSIIAILNIFLFGILCGLLAYIMKDIYLVSAIHFAWNYYQGHVYGINVSGNVTNDSFYQYNALGNTLLNGGIFGVEGGFIATSVLATASLVMILYCTRKLIFKKKPQKVLN